MVLLYNIHQIVKFKKTNIIKIVLLNNRLILFKNHIIIKCLLFNFNI